MDKIKKLLDKITWKKWLLFLLLSQTVYGIMQFYTIPLLYKEAGNFKIFDLLPTGYTYAYAKLFLSQLSPRGYVVYKWIQVLLLDLIYPFLNAVTGICTLTVLYRFHGYVKRRGTESGYKGLFIAAAFLPVCVMAADYLENIMILIMLSLREAVPREAVAAAAAMTRVKSMGTVLFYSIVTVYFIGIGLLWIHKKRKRGGSIERV